MRSYFQYRAIPFTQFVSMAHRELNQADGAYLSDDAESREFRELERDGWRLHSVHMDWCIFERKTVRIPPVE